MQSIYKYPIQVTNIQVIPMRAGSEILCVMNQNDKPCIWVKVPDVNAPYEDRVIYIYPTGEIVEEIQGTYIGTIKYARYYIWHVYDGGVV